LKKSEKLSQAVYRVTDFLNDSDPIKWEARKMSLKVVSDITSFISKKDTLFFDKEVVLESIVRSISILEIAHGGSLSTHTNFLLLKEEYENLRGVIVEMGYSPAEEKSFTVSESDLFDGEKLLSSLTDSRIKDNMYKGHEMSFIQAPSSVYALEAKKAKGSFANSVSQNNLKNRAFLSKGHSVQNVKNVERQEAILKLVREKKEVNIKDILAVNTISSGASEKTIQRELLRLVAAGVLQKQGERRWSRYSLPK
jgi:hypothetical protein